MPPPHLATADPSASDVIRDSSYDIAAADRTRDYDDEKTGVLSPFPRAAPLPGTLDLQLNGKQRSSIIEYIQREDEPADEQQPHSSALLNARDRPDSDEDDDEDAGGQGGGGARLMDPFYRELEKAEEERNKRKEDELEAREDMQRQRNSISTPLAIKSLEEDKSRKRSSVISSPTTTSSSRRSSAISTPHSASFSSPHVASTSLAAPSSRRMSRPAGDSLLVPGGSLGNSRAPSRSSLSASGAKQKPRMLAGRNGRTSVSGTEGQVVGLPAVVLVGNGGRRRLDKQLAMVRQSVEEVEANMRRKMEREKEKDRERQAREQQQQQLQQQSIREEEAEDESADTVTATLTTITSNNTADDSNNSTTEQQQQQQLVPVRSRSGTATGEAGKELVVRTDSALVRSEGGPFAAILHNLSFANTLLPLTPEELAMSPDSLTTPTSPLFPALSRPLLAHTSASAPVSPRPVQYQSCFPAWLSSRPDFSAFVGQHQLLCLHLAEKERDKRSVKDLGKLSDFFSAFPFFHKFSAHTLTELSRCCSIERRKRGERVDSKSETGSVMRFVYEGEVTYETSIARLFKRKRKEREREQRQKSEKEKREADKRERERQREAAAARGRSGSKMAKFAATAASIAAVAPPSRGRSATQTQALGATAPLSANNVASGSSPPQSQGGTKPAQTRGRSNGQPAPDSAAALRARSTTLPMIVTAPTASAAPTTAAGSATSATPSQRSSLVAPSNAILSHALTFDPNDSTQALPVVPAASPAAAVAPAFASDNSLDELLVTHKLLTGDTFGQSLLFEHLFASFSFSQIYRLKQQQRLHALLSRNTEQRGWGAARQLVRSLLEQKSALHIHSVEVVSDECLFFCWQHADLEAIAKESRRFDTSEMVGALRVLPFFAAWPFSSIQDTAARAESRTVKRGEWLTREGEPTNSLFFVVRGEVEAVKHCRLVQAERWPAGAHQWEVTKTQRVKAYAVGRMGEGEVVGVEGVCGVATRDFSVRVVSATCVVYVVKRVAFAGWSGMKKVMRDCQARMLEWREKATTRVQLQAEGKHSKGQPWEEKRSEPEHAKLVANDTDAGAAAQSSPQQPQEESKVQLEGDAPHVHSHQSSAPQFSREQSTAHSRLSTHSHRQPPQQGSAHHAVANSASGDVSEEQTAERRERRKRLKEEEAARVRRGTQRNEDYWLDRVLTVERMQEDKARRRELASHKHSRDDAAKPASAKQPPQQNEQLAEAMQLTGELPLLSDREEVRARHGSGAVAGGGIRVERQAAAIDLHQRRAVVDRTLDSQRWETAMSAVVQLHFDAPT